MAWRGDKFYYSIKMLKTIAENYTSLYEGLEFRSGQLETNPWALAEYKADFDIALQSIGKGRWTGSISKFRDYRYYGRLQQIVIADILGRQDFELRELGFYSIPRLRACAYSCMKESLNGKDDDENQP